MRFKDKKLFNKTYNLSKIKNILNKCGCDFVALLDKDKKKLDKNGICKYVTFSDVTFHKTYIIEYKKMGIDNVMKIVNKKE